MTYVVPESGLDVLDRAHLEKRRVACIYEVGRPHYIHPAEYVDRGACEPVCPVDTLYYEDDIPVQWADFTANNTWFFTELLPGQAAGRGSPGGASKVGQVGPDTPLVASHPPRG